jgi:hypothetical protein
MLRAIVKLQALQCQRFLPTYARFFQQTAAQGTLITHSLCKSDACKKPTLPAGVRIAPRLQAGCLAWPKCRAGRGTGGSDPLLHRVVEVSCPAGVPHCTAGHSASGEPASAEATFGVRPVSSVPAPGQLAMKLHGTDAVVRCW